MKWIEKKADFESNITGICSPKHSQDGQFISPLYLISSRSLAFGTGAIQAPSHSPGWSKTRSAFAVRRAEKHRQRSQTVRHAVEQFTVDNHCRN